jgi:hypothetical protein
MQQVLVRIDACWHILDEDNVLAGPVRNRRALAEELALTDALNAFENCGIVLLDILVHRRGTRLGDSVCDINKLHVLLQQQRVQIAQGLAYVCTGHFNRTNQEEIRREHACHTCLSAMASRPRAVLHPCGGSDQCELSDIHDEMLGV